ncbi:MAG: zinc ribbon domain-containing protein [Candidatus Bathyarchaeia archaeon]
MRSDEEAQSKGHGEELGAGAGAAMVERARESGAAKHRGARRPKSVGDGKFCIHCGAKIPGVARFCIICGRPQ